MQNLSVVVWKWGVRYSSSQINKVYHMLLRNLHVPSWRFYCITDDSRGLDSGIYVESFPSYGLGRCRRLLIFDRSGYGRFSERILQLDVDCVITGDITPLIDRTEPFVIWQSVHNTRWVIGLEAPGYIGGALVDNSKPWSNPYNASMFLMDAGVMPNLWDEYIANPELVEGMAKKAGHWTALVKEGKGILLPPGDDDQAVITLYARRLYPRPVTWGEEDGIYKYKRIVDTGLPDNARMVFFQGRDIGERAAKSSWIGEHWK